MLFFDGRYPRYAFPVLAEYSRPKRIPQEVKLLFWYLADACLLLVDREQALGLTVPPSW
jgi:hypothetical protein